MTKEEIIDELNVITSDHRFIQVIASINFLQFCGSLVELSKKNPFDNLNYNEYRFLIGLWLKNHSNNNSQSEKYNVGEVYVRVHELMESLHYTFIVKISDLNSKKRLSFAEVMNDGNSFKEAFFYSGAGAYDDQYIRLAVDKYALDEDWIEKNKGFSIKSAISFFDNIRIKVTEKLNDKDVRKSIVPNEGPVLLFCLTYDEIINNNEEFTYILENFSTYYGSNIVSKLDDIADYNAFTERPIIKLRDEKYFIAIPFSIGEAIYETPFYWMTKDNSYKNTSLSNRGKAGENITHSILTNVFGKGNVFKGIDIKKNKSSTATDIDVLAIHKGIGIIFQVKSKKLTSLSKQGDILSIRDDFNKAVENAFVQGRVSKECIMNSSDYKFITDEGENVTNKLHIIKDVYIICIVLDEFPAITHAVQVFLYDKYPDSTIALSVPDLDTICRILKNPERIIDYFSKRINNCRYYHSDSETSFLGYYLKHDLKPVAKMQGALIDPTFSSQVDKPYYDSFVNKIDKLITKKKVQRNDTCSCGSGIKYKKCCMLKS